MPRTMFYDTYLDDVVTSASVKFDDHKTVPSTIDETELLVDHLPMPSTTHRGRPLTSYPHTTFGSL